MKINKSRKFSEFFDYKNECRKIDFLVLHHIEARSVEHAIEQLLEHKVSSHFLVDESGKIFELVDENDVAYHAGVSFWRGCDGLNKSSIGIEFINSAPFEKRFEDVQMRSGVELCDYLIKKYHIEARNVVGHSDIAYYPSSALRAPSPTRGEGNVIRSRVQPLLPLWEKVPEGRMRGNSLDRKQDPSHLFDWEFLAKNGVGIFPEISLDHSIEKKLFEFGNKDSAIAEIKKNLQKFGYRITNSSDVFDEEAQALVRVFNRRFNPEKFIGDSDAWYLSSQLKLDYLMRQL